MLYQKEQTNTYITTHNGIIIPPPVDKNEKIEYNVNSHRLCGVINTDNEYIDISARSCMVHKEPTGYWEERNKEKVKYIDEDVIYLGIIGGPFMAYGNLILDSVSRIWIFLENEEYKNLKAVYFSDDNYQDKIVLTLFKLFGLKEENLIRCTEPLQAKNVIIPEESIDPYSFYTVEFKQTIDKIKEQIPAKEFPKIYFSRSKLNGCGKTYGEEYIENIFKNAGYKIIYPEQLSITEQIAYLKGAQYFAGVDGSGVHNALFLQDGANCIYLQRSEYKNNVQPIIDEMKTLNTQYIQANIETFRLCFYGNPYLIGLTKDLKRFFNKNNFKYSEYEYQKNLKKILPFYLNALANSYSVKTNLDNHYSDKELQTFANFRKLLKYQNQFLLPVYKRFVYKFKLYYYLKRKRYNRVKKYYKNLYL